ncbi:uncharacterized protein LOC107365647 isoform X2 [Tetranychus urticae]|uniref:Uncharacterized protein n=2 Tax=Tetranychus urticae TaxID=32264 RepID=T1KMN6_TETUR|nr:uncharacterized protein LOC107365647 isoform X2 [Tetranychus urticae]XP_015788676.1 uncharacterized protein LOC107365647 isoform X2 [Tetranychus urticae]
MKVKPFQNQMVAQFWIKLNVSSLWSLIFTLLLILNYLTLSVDCRGNGPDCPAKLDNCTTMVKPYLHDLKYMFPTTIDDVDEMCKMWSLFVDCVRRYVTTCFTEERRMKFNSAVEDSVAAVHAICSSETVQREYLSHAQCFRRVSVENCGSSYKQLIDIVSNQRSHDEHICCFYGHFKECVSDPLIRECGPRARNLMDHSMGFLITRCSQKYTFSSGAPCSTPAPATERTIAPKYESLNSDDTNSKSEKIQEIEGSTSTISYSLPRQGRISSSNNLRIQFLQQINFSLLTFILLSILW